MHKKRSRKACVGGGSTITVSLTVKNPFSTTFLLSKDQIFLKRLKKIKQNSHSYAWSTTFFFFIMGYFPFVTMGPHIVWTLLKFTIDPRPYTETFSLWV